MKRRLTAVLLSLGLSALASSMSVYAQETTASSETVSESEETNASAEKVTEEPGTEAAKSDTEASAESDTETEASTEAITELAGETEAASPEDSYKDMITNYLTQISAWSDDQVDAYMDSTDSATALVAMNWSSVKSELGNFVEVTEITDTQTSSDGYGGSVTGLADYDGVPGGTEVSVTVTYGYTYSSAYSQYVMTLDNIEWNIDYPLGVLLQRAGLNTIMGLVVVFVALLFLSWLIGRLHYITDLVEGRKKEEPEEEPETAEPLVPAKILPEQPGDQTDDEEIAAVIMAAIVAASEDGEVSHGNSYRVKSIKKIGKRNWRRA